MKEPTAFGVNLLAGKFVMDALAERNCAQLDVQFFMDGATKLLQARVEQALNDCKKMIVEEKMDPNEAFECLKLGNRDLDPFRGLRTQYSQIKFFKNNFDLVMPLKIELPLIPEDLVRTRTGKERTFRKQDYVYVPLLSQLEKLLSMRDVYREVKTEYKPSPTHYGRYEDGENFKTNPLFQRHPRALQLHLYLDEVQMCNPISSYSHKIVYVYFALGNLPPRMRSTYKSINLLCIFYYEQTALHDINLLLRPIIDDIKKLENGVELVIKGEKVCQSKF